MEEMTASSVNLEKANIFCVSSAEFMMKNEGQSATLQWDAAALRNGVIVDFDGTDVSFQRRCVSRDNLALQTVKDGDAPATSPTSSYCLTEAPHTTGRPTSTLSNTPALQSLYPLASSNGVQTNSLVNGTDIDGFVPGFPFDFFSFPNCDNGFVDNGAFFSSPKNQACKISSNHEDDTVSMLYGLPQTSKDGVWGSKTNVFDTSEKGIESYPNGHNSLPTISVTPSESVNFSMKEKVGCMNRDEDKEPMISVVDPQRAKLRVFLSAVFPTKALEAHAQNPSLCLLFQAGRCRQGANCHQVHVDPDVVQRLRRISESFPCCCTFHGDCNAKLWNAEEGLKHGIVVGNVMVPLSRVAFTSGLTRFIPNAMQRSLNPDALCRLHGKAGGCRYGVDCWYLHVCREILRRDFAFVIESSDANPLSDCGVKSSSRAARQKETAIRGDQKSPQQWQQKKQFNLYAAGPQSLSPIINCPPSMDNAGDRNNTNDNNSNNGNTINCRNPTIFIAPPCRWVNSVLPMPVLEPTSVKVPVGGNAGVLNGGILNNTPRCNSSAPCAASAPCGVSPDPAASLASGPFANPRAFFVPVGQTDVKPRPVPSFPSYYPVTGMPAPGAAAVGMNLPPSATYSPVWISQQQWQLQGRQTCPVSENWNVMGGPAFIVSQAPY